ncbi:hypothetical protein [Robertkochia flava]|uniref:hypothetical protein n=1 Tax=Robertkochia flava TaxID=3447986 RepID=UPI001CCF0197|nr:hypothetical protein [Robertkochia marina]
MKESRAMNKDELPGVCILRSDERVKKEDKRWIPGNMRLFNSKVEKLYAPSALRAPSPDQEKELFLRLENDFLQCPFIGVTSAKRSGALYFQLMVASDACAASNPIRRKKQEKR